MVEVRMSELTDFRRAKDNYFKTGPGSPLTLEQQQAFTGLSYFPENPALRFDLPLEPYAHPEKVTMQTSTGSTQDYYKVGQIHFQTYGAGRYLEPEEIHAGELRVDLNLSYNPYCAYNDRWSCPFPPPENRVKVRIEAGEKSFHS
ncbi:MAG: DUF1684 domain-containing protein [Chloroflexi bacterium]|nr:DUF1684 domain-containing protein [Chloroflexota bacterium]